MASVDPVRISKTITFLLRHKPEVGRLAIDHDGWTDLERVAATVSRLLRAEVTAERIQDVADRARVRRFEVRDGRIRIAPRRRRGHAARPPDILYHATTADLVDEARELGAVQAGARQVYLSSDEAEAWRVAHRLHGEPTVLYIDTTRARRHGVRFFSKGQGGLYVAQSVPVSDVLNLQPNYACQLSAGGVPVRFTRKGKAQVALIRVTRRSGVTWEVAKGKLEPGEPPERAAVREVIEEMGLDVQIHVTRYVGQIRYGFLTPQGHPRLKAVFLYLMEPDGNPTSFSPSTREGIGEVRWFDIHAAARAVTHSSLIPMMARIRDILQADRAYASPPALPVDDAPRDPETP